jgi:beta-hydroxylase
VLVSTQSAEPDLRQESGSAPEPTPAPGAAQAGVDMAGERPRPLIIRLGKHLRGVFDRLIAASSLVSNAPVLDMRDFAWTALLRADWRTIRDEAVAVARGDARSDAWRPFFLWGYSFPIEDNIARCPKTAAIVAQIPGLNSAYFSILAPGAHIPEHRGVTKGLITCHLALIVPRDGDVRMRVGNRVMRWAEGETLVFDDTYSHELWNETGGTRVVLLIQFARPLRNPGKWVADAFLRTVRRSAFVREARDNILCWNTAVKQMDF